MKNSDMKKELFNLNFQNKKNPLSVNNVNMRTTSSLESFNSVLGRLFPRHPHLFRFIDRLRLIEFSKTLDLMDLIENELPDDQFQRRRLRDKKREEKIKYFTIQLQTDGDMSPADFLEAMANKDILPGNGKIYKYFPYASFRL